MIYTIEHSESYTNDEKHFIFLKSDSEGILRFVIFQGHNHGRSQ